MFGIPVGVLSVIVFTAVKVFDAFRAQHNDAVYRRRQSREDTSDVNDRAKRGGETNA